MTTSLKYVSARKMAWEEGIDNFSGAGESIFILVEKEIFFSGIIGPNVLDTLINITLVFDFLKVFQHF